MIKNTLRHKFFLQKKKKKKKLRKRSIAHVRLGFKYVLHLGEYWLEKLIVEKKFKKSLTLIWKYQEKICYGIQRRII